MNYDLSILIPARNEEFLKNTVEDILKNKRGKTEVIVGLDGKWANPPLVDHPDVTIVYVPESIGQRAMTNQLCRLSQSKYVMKCDAHCAFDEGFDVKMMADMQDDWTMVPMMYNLHVFDWKCRKCGKRWYMGPEPTHCMKEEHVVNPDCDNITDFTKRIVWQPRHRKRTDSWCFDSNLHFQYWSAFRHRPEAQGDIVDTMSLIGACWMVTRDRYWYLNMSDEKHGSWGQQGTEVACKSWLSGGRLVVNKKTWFAHMFRTQTGFGFPYPQSNSQVDQARAYSKDTWFNNKFEKQTRPLSWLLRKFAPISGWSEEQIKEQENREKTNWVK